MMMTDTERVEVLRDANRIGLLVDPDRRRLVDALLERPDSAVGLARRLGDSRQRLNYHLGVLADAGLLEVAEERQRRGAVERVYRVVARRFAVDPGVLGTLSPEPDEGDRFSATYLVALASRTIAEVAELMERARATEKRLPTAGLSAEVRLASPSDFNAFAEELAGAVAAVVARYHTEEGEARSFRVTAGAYPWAAAADGDETEPDDREDRG